MLVQWYGLTTLFQEFWRNTTGSEASFVWLEVYCAYPSNNAVNPDFVGDADAATLHRFLWLKDDEIGELSVKWNRLVGEYYNPTEDIKVLH